MSASIQRVAAAAVHASAEEGSFHILAQRLGALFYDVLPDVPKLLEVYGLRVTEILQETMATIEQPKGLAETFFGSHLGIDYTTIGASATSGRPEATATWEELVSHRQLVIKQQAVSNEAACYNAT
ncbi:uncharacterized protein ACLA_042490 [Aspergillus clavatus NRRL 1]|uniref:Uncharacterized protein n=1 Tax=Aspergillus clavatus (strain ATCC 1007 / CBS 513.65 / DSM 816 / NCTC 3887 / NRRL 1 / QM 1276 / 107) TaxID=344612 RepID=A1CLK2_ASPCL|nr:uncharacterized protein ACLA_042490 [Aspergillus clavatus NRRL 1]EAW10026.1 hypothetical protein ACLA_042490 [Aspergillus clavatus NRRL 1]